MTPEMSVVFVMLSFLGLQIMPGIVVEESSHGSGFVGWGIVWFVSAPFFVRCVVLDDSDPPQAARMTMAAVAAAIARIFTVSPQK